MSLKENIDMVKDELNSEEKMFEKAVVIEKFLKKYKLQLIAAFIIITVAVIGNIAYEVNKEGRIVDANKALATLLKDSNSATAKQDLEVLSPELYTLWNYSQAIADQDVKALEALKSSHNSIIADVATYEAASISQDAKALQKYASDESAIYKDLARIQRAIILIKTDKIEKAHQELQKIATESPLQKVASALLHYGVK